MSEPEPEQTQEQDGPEPDEATPEQPPSEEEEAAEAEEAEQVEGAPAGEGEQPEASGAAGAVGEKELERMFKRVETANASYARKLGEIMGEESQVLERCPRCNEPFLGLIFPPAMKPVAGPQKDAVLVSVGEQPPMATNKDPYSRRCETCDGSGVCDTGSRRPEEKGIKCLPCNGRGWLPVGDERRVGRSDIAPAAQSNGQTEGAPASMAASEPAPGEDLWGRRAGDPNYGVHPMYVASR